MRSSIINKICIILLLCMPSVGAIAAGFIATVDNNTINFGQSITVQLRLEDAKALESIDISPFAKDFMIYNQQQFSSYRNVNGVVKAESGWNITLMPKKEGEFILPSISMETDHGRFSTQEIKITVRHPKAGDKSANDNIGISLVSIVSKNKTYVNEPIIYTLKIISYKPIANIVLDDIKSSDAIIEKIGDTKQSNQTLGGVNAHVIEIRYAVTAIRPGKVKIAPAIMHGELQVLSSQVRRPQRFGIFNDMFMDNMVELKPFSLQSDTIIIDAQPAPIKSQNWLPLYNLTLSEKFDGIENAKVGETITRKIKMVAKGTFAKQIPSVKDFIEHAHVKIYANKPTFSDTFSENSGTVVGVREEEYSIVPQQAGTITLPEIKITWYNLQTKRTETSTLPAKTITVAPGVISSTPNVTIDYSNQDKPQEIVASTNPVQSKPALVYILLGIMGGFLITALLVILFFASKKIMRSKLKKSKIKTAKQKVQDIEITNALSLRSYILQYAIKHWHVPQDLFLNRLGDALSNNNYIYDIQLYSELCSSLNAAIYSNETIDLELLISTWNEFKDTVIKHKKSNRANMVTEDYTSLNPT